MLNSVSILNCLSLHKVMTKLEELQEKVAFAGDYQKLSTIIVTIMAR